MPPSLRRTHIHSSQFLVNFSTSERGEAMASRAQQAWPDYSIEPVPPANPARLTVAGSRHVSAR
jgi:hypothetical protein